MEAVLTQYDYLAELVTIYGGQILLALAVLIIGLWLIKKTSGISSRSLVKHFPDETLAKFLSGAWMPY